MIRVLAVLLSFAFAGAFAGCSTPARVPASGYDAGQPWKFVVLSDIHVYPDGRVAPAFLKLVERLATEVKPRLVIITGDSTNGNQGDGRGLQRVRSWWKSLHAALKPLRD